MSTVIVSASMSLDGFVSGPDESGFDRLFAWHHGGEVAVPSAQPDRTFHMRAASARVWAELTAGLGALVVGRKTFDLTKGWGGNHPLGVPVVVLTHRMPEDSPSASFTFVTDGIESAVGAARRIAGDRKVGITAGEMTGQALDAGLVDEIWVSLVPVVLGGGVPFFAALGTAPVALTGPVVTEDACVTHLRYTVDRG
jgi:dihydrofolate reductase